MRRQKRELSEAQFKEQLAKRGFRQAGSFPWPTYKTDEFPHITFGGIVHAKTFKTMRRATLAYLDKTARRFRKEQASSVETSYDPHRRVPDDEVIGKLPYVCDCGDSEEVDVTFHDWKQGYVTHVCGRTGGTTDLCFGQAEREHILETRIAGNNLPDDMQDTVRGMF